MEDKIDHRKKGRKSLKMEKTIQALRDGALTVKDAMRIGGYAEKTNPTNRFRSLFIQEAFGDYLNNDDILTAHKELLNQRKIEYFTFPLDMPDKEIEEKVNAVGIQVVNIQPGEKKKYAFYYVVDKQARTSALDMAYKIVGAYAPEKSVNLNVDADNTNTEEIQALTKKLNELYRRESEPSDGELTSALDPETQDEDGDGLSA